ncbi:hypothetical protein QTP88_025808 [Uroleucon formosanum]
MHLIVSMAFQITSMTFDIRSKISPIRDNFLHSSSSSTTFPFEESMYPRKAYIFHKIIMAYPIKIGEIS